MDEGFRLKTFLGPFPMLLVDALPPLVMVVLIGPPELVSALPPVLVAGVEVDGFGRADGRSVDF